MKFAINQQGRIVYAQDISLDDSYQLSYFCPNCGQRLIIKVSKLGNIFFSHRFTCGSEAGESKNLSRGESVSHQEFKNHIIQECHKKRITVFEEYSINNNDRIADIYIPSCNHLIIEYQQSKISSQNVAKRNNLYEKLGYQCIWVLDEEAVDSTSMELWMLSMIQYHEQWGYYLISWDKQAKHFVLRDHLSIYMNVKSIKNKYRQFSLTQILWEISDRRNKTYKYQCDTTRSITPIDISEIEKIPSHQYYKKLMQIKGNSSYFPWLNILYRNHMTLEDLPPSILIDNRIIVGLKIPQWLFWVKIYFWITQYHKQGYSINMQALRYFLRNAMRENEIIFSGLLAKKPRFIEDLLHVIWLYIPSFLQKMNNN